MFFCFFSYQKSEKVGSRAVTHMWFWGPLISSNCISEAEIFQLLSFLLQIRTSNLFPACFHPAPEGA